MVAIDMSNYTDRLTAQSVQKLIEAGTDHVIAQSLYPPPGYPIGQTRRQINLSLNAGLVTDAYLWLWFDLDVSDIHAKLSLLDGLAIRTIWLDVEDAAARRYNQADTEAKIQAALDACDAYGTTLDRPKGIYTGRWYWASPLYVANSTTFSDRPLWDANYDGIPDVNQGFTPYGGWGSCAVKQYAGTSRLAGVGGLDLNAISEAEKAA